MQIIGITGTLGAGKGAVVDYLEQKGYSHFSVREFLFKEIRRRGLPENRDSTNLVGEDLRSKHSPSYIIECLYEEARKAENNAVIESVRAMGEVTFLKKQPNCFLIAVDADPHIRYDRAVKRKSALDHVSYEKFIFDEQREMFSDDPGRMSLSDCIKAADFVILNESTKEELHKKVEEVLKKISPK
jgi:dephospho-CoA kinase